METIEKEPAIKKTVIDILNNHAKNWINGEWIDAVEQGLSLNPATGEQIGSYADGSQIEARRAVAAAVRAFRETSWKNDYSLRSKILLSIADRIESVLLHSHSEDNLPVYQYRSE